MKIAFSRCLLVISSACFCSCGTGKFARSDDQPRDKLSQPTIQDEVALPPDIATLGDLAFTFPVFELGPEETKKNIARGDVHVELSGKQWILEGDGAQPTVTVDRLTAVGEFPVRVRLTYGPMLDGASYVYDFERIGGGWKRLDYKRVEQDAAMEVQSN